MRDCACSASVAPVRRLFLPRPSRRRASSTRARRGRPNSEATPKRNEKDVASREDVARLVFCFPRHPGFRQLPFLGRPAERHCVEKRKKLFFLTSSLRLALRFGSLSRPPRAALSTPPPTSLSRRTRMSRMSRPLRPEPSVLFLFATCGASRWPASSAARPTEKRRRPRTRRDVF